MPVDQWIGPAAVVDLTHLGDNGEVSAAELDRHAGHVQAGDIVLLRTDWPKKVDVATEKFWKDAPYTARERVRLAGRPPGEGGRLRLPAGLHGASRGIFSPATKVPPRGARDALRLLPGRHHGHRVPDQPRRRSARRAAASWRCRSGSKAPTALRSAPSPSWSDAPTPPTTDARHGADRSPAGPHGRRDQRAVPARLPRVRRRAASPARRSTPARYVLGNGKTETLARYLPEERPLAMQLLGADPDVLAEAARRLEATGADGIDLNMGCPVAKIVTKGQGSALMRDPLAAAVDLPHAAQGDRRPLHDQDPRRLGRPHGERRRDRAPRRERGRRRDHRPPAHALAAVHRSGAVGRSSRAVVDAVRDPGHRQRRRAERAPTRARWSRPPAARRS